MEIRLKRAEVEELVAMVDQLLSEYASNKELRLVMLDKLEKALSQNPRAVTFILSPGVLHRGMVGEG